MANKFAPIYSVKIWTSSHGMPNHFLPKSINTLYAENEFIEKPSINAKPGRLINEILVDEFKNDFELIPHDKPRINVICFGDNDIRCNAFKGGFRLYKYTKEIVEIHKNSKNPLLVLGVMPSPETFVKTQPLSEYSDDLIQKHIVGFHEKGECRHIAFATTSDFLSDSEGFLLNKIYFSKDQIHLNENGAMTLAAKILEISTILAQIVQDGYKKSSPENS